MFTSWSVHLLSPSTLPSLASVRSLVLNTPKSTAEYDPDGPNVSLRKLDHRVLLDIATKCPNLVMLQCRTGGDEWLGGFISPAMNDKCQDWAGPRRDSRQDFYKALKALPGLRHVQLDFLWPIITVAHIEQRIALPNLIKPAIFDTFSTSLRLLSQPLRTMSLRVCADETLFWPTDGTSDTPFWPNLESMNVMFHMSHPSGSWYFRGLPTVGTSEGFDTTDDHYPPYAATEKDWIDDLDDRDWFFGDPYACCRFRVEPNEETLVPFLTAFAKAAACMPSLKEFAIWSPLEFSEWEFADEYENFDSSTVSKYANYGYCFAWGIAYAAPVKQDFTVFPKGDYSPSRRIWWRAARWRPDAGLHGLFQTIGLEQHGDGLRGYWNDEGIINVKDFDCGEGLSNEDWFTDWEKARWTVDLDL